MNPRTAVVALFLAALASPVLATVVAPQTMAQTFPQPAEQLTDAQVADYAGRMATLGLLTTPAQAAASAPVQRVNSLTGNVVLPTYSRATNATPIAVNTTTGNASFDYTTAGFGNMPGCQVEVMSTATGYVFAQPVTVSKTLTSVTVNLQAALKLLSISLGALTVWTAPPVGTTVNFICIAQN